MMTNALSIQDTQHQLIEEFLHITDWDARYAHIIELGKALPKLDDALKTDDNIVRGCQSQVWMVSQYNDDNTITFQADSDALIVRGLIAMILRVYNGYTPDDILATPPEFLEKMELGKHISMTRSNGLAAMIKQIQFYAMAYKAKAASS